MNKIFLYLLFCLPLLATAQKKELTKQEYIERVKANRDSISSLVDLRRVGGYTPEYTELQNLYNTLTKKVKKSNEGKEFATYLQTLSTVMVGKQAPEFSQNDTTGTPVKLSDFKGQYVLLDFWASWCPDCRVESPDLVKTYAIFKDKNFEILGISFDKDRASWIKAIHADQLHWKHVSDLKRWQNDVGTLYGVKSIPQNVLIDPTGKIIARNLHGEELNSKLREVLK
ncbi:TlpA family protein disulfide reductase [Sphingobacterium sp. SRCM116780]|uniref:peroxiredoxin family protein n=1 Tax=Sphingobacterium sp. SRCM116780 TaxID=2907623 RepID=UPI001F2A4BB9|nr:TlpA disulfide reductase family protein [Sphingobacterium sp. SRCM116780]UIR55660.1 TlpA family protein disulfide reductase [Sphingobacterium sp. SRCM116780]